MTNTQIDALFEANILELDKLSIPAGGMIKALLAGLEDNGPAYIRLRNAVVNGHKIEYEHVEGDKSLVGRVGRALGLNCGPDTIEIPSSGS